MEHVDCHSCERVVKVHGVLIRGLGFRVGVLMSFVDLVKPCFVVGWHEMEVVFGQHHSLIVQCAHAIERSQRQRVLIAKLLSDVLNRELVSEVQFENAVSEVGELTDFIENLVVIMTCYVEVARHSVDQKSSLHCTSLSLLESFSSSRHDFRVILVFPIPLANL